MRNGLHFDSYDFAGVRDVICEKLAEGRTEIPLRFADKTAYDSAVDALITKTKAREIIQYANLRSEMKVGTGYSYSLSEEKLVISLFFKKV